MPVPVLMQMYFNFSRRGTNMIYKKYGVCVCVGVVGCQIAIDVLIMVHNKTMQHIFFFLNFN